MADFSSQHTKRGFLSSPASPKIHYFSSVSLFSIFREAFILTIRITYVYFPTGIPWWLSGKESAYNAGDLDPLGWKDPLVKEMAICFSTLAWKIPVDRGALLATVHRVAKSRTLQSD